MNDQTVGKKKKTQNNAMKELLDQHAQQGKSHHVFLDRDLILQPHRVNRTKRYRLLALENENRSSKQNTAAASPETPASIRDQPDSLQVAQRGKWVSVNSWSHSFRHLSLTPSKNPAPSHEILSRGIHKLLSPTRKQENILSSHERCRMGGKEVQLRKEANSVLLRI